MNRTELLRAWWSRSRISILKGLFLYVLFPAVCLPFLAPPIGSAARNSDSAAFLIILAALGAVCLNWFVYAAVHRKRPSLLVFAYGVFCLLLVVIIEYDAVPRHYSLAATLAVIGGCLALTFMFLLSYWLAARRSRPAHAVAVGLWITIGLIAVLMAFSVWRDIESHIVNQDTWISIAIIIAIIPAAFIRKIRAAVRRAQFRRRANGLAAGRITQMIGETRLDRDGDLVTDYHALIQYTVDGVNYDTRADIYKITMRRFGKQAFVGQEIPVHYDPANPGDAFANRIDRHFFDREEQQDTEQKRN